MSMNEGWTFSVYPNCFWELYNKIGGNNGLVATSTFKVGLPIDSELRTSLILKLVTDMQKLIERVEEYKRLEVDQLQAKSKAKAPATKRKEIRVDRPAPRPRSKMSGDPS